MAAALDRDTVDPAADHAFAELRECADAHSRSEANDRCALPLSHDSLIDELERKNVDLSEALDRAQAAIRAKSEFLANMSHELRTPLNAIIGFAELLQSEVYGPVGAEQYRGYVKDIQSSGAHLLGIINDILDLSKAEAGKMELNEDVVDLGAAVTAACRVLRHRTEEARIVVSNELRPDLPRLRVDERMVKQMLINLLSNAAKFTSAGGLVVISAEAAVDGPLRLTVRDNGIGIPLDYLERVLEPFAQVDGSLSRRYDGAGLGLPLVKAMIELHGGRLHLESMIGGGTTVTLAFPPDRVIASNRA
jgi:two-component system cell cycle sensor histidine kinase PleC